ncbi:MAG: LytR C-terminal domain-containing protein [Sphingomicrobium sp.]
MAEAHAQFALGNVALALERYRAVYRQDERNIDALAGIAKCYQSMGRPELAQRQYELALAISPDEPGLLAALATTLEMQGLADKAAQVRSELAQRESAKLALNTPSVAKPIASAPAVADLIVPAPAAVEVIEASARPALIKAPAPAPQIQAPVASVAAASKPEPVSAPVGPTVTVNLPPPVAMEGAKPIGNSVGRSVTVALAPARPEPAMVMAKAEPRLRLERTSLGEVTLRTRGSSSWAVLKVVEPNAGIRYASKASGGLHILNGARTAGLAASTRAYLMSRGWRAIEVSDADKVRERSVLYAPRNRARTAASLAAQFRFPVLIASSSSDFVLILGKDAKPARERRPG